MAIGFHTTGGGHMRESDEERLALLRATVEALERPEELATLLVARLRVEGWDPEVVRAGENLLRWIRSAPEHEAAQH